MPRIAACCCLDDSNPVADDCRADCPRRVSLGYFRTSPPRAATEHLFRVQGLAPGRTTTRFQRSDRRMDRETVLGLFHGSNTHSPPEERTDGPEGQRCIVLLAKTSMASPATCRPCVQAA